MKRPIYLDHHSTTPVDPRVLEAMLPFFGEEFGNAASRTHAFGWRAETATEMAREEIARAIGAADASEIVFTSGATESNNLALQGRLAALAGSADEVVTVSTEHRSVLDPCERLERRGVRITRLPVDADGMVDPQAVSDAITDRTALVSVMLANNEIGVVQPLAEIGRRCAERGVLLHTDAAQAVAKMPVDVRELGVAMLSLSAHKCYGPKGVGALYVRRRPRVALEPLLYGGGHERGLRSGTLPVPLVVGFGEALRIGALELEAEARRLAELRDELWGRLSRELPGVHRNGHATRRLPGNLHVSFEGVAADALLAELTEVALSTGSACSSATTEPSHVLKALGISPERVRGGVRIGLGRFTSREDLSAAAGALIRRVEELRRRSPLAPIQRRD